MTAPNRLEELFSHLFQAHPWHGVSPGPESLERVTAYVEIVPTDTVKYELEKGSGHLKIDRPQRYSSICPTLYGFIPQTYCGDEVAKRCADRTRPGDTIVGDGDPLDICILTEKVIPSGNFLAQVVPIGGFRMIDGDEADDKIIAVLESDLMYGSIRDVSKVPAGIVERLEHYFLSYKQLPLASLRRTTIAEVYDRTEAHAVIRASVKDYRDNFGDPSRRLQELRELLATR